MPITNLYGGGLDVGDGRTAGDGSNPAS